MQPVITPDLLNSALSFEQYLNLTKDILADSSKAPGKYADPATFRYTQSNLERMQKTLAETVVSQRLYNLLSELKDEWVWVVISEPWCGDASWGLTALYLFAQSSDKIDFKIVLRDQHPEVISAYQTNGGNAIPKLVCFRKADMLELGTWGPRPQVLQQQVLAWKDTPGIEFRESVRMLHAWYEQDMSRAIDNELCTLVKQWKDVV